MYKDIPKCLSCCIALPVPCAKASKYFTALPLNFSCVLVSLSYQDRSCVLHNYSIKNV